MIRDLLQRIFVWIVLSIISIAVLFFLMWASSSGAFAKGRLNSIAFGDSIAFGTGHAAGLPTVAVVGASVCTILGWLPPRGGYDHVVLSAGINVPDQKCVAGIRATIRAKQIIWILPAPINQGRALVEGVLRPGDRTVSYACKGPCTKNNFHPGSYSKVWADVRKQW